MLMKTKRPSFSRVLLPILAVVGIIVSVVLIALGQPDRTVEQPVETPARATGTLANAARVAGSGVVEPSSEIVDIGTAVSGLVSRVLVSPGDYVSRGQPLFTIDDRQVRARLAEAEAGIAQARAAIAEAQAAEGTASRNLALFRSVGDPAAVSRAEIIRAEGEVSTARSRAGTARAQLAAAQAVAASARTELGRLTVTAPISGTILRAEIKAGEFVTAGNQGGGNSTPFLQMGETRPLHVRIDIDEDEIAKLEPGAAAFVTPRGSADRQVQARFVRAEPLVIPKRSLTNSAAERVDVRVLQVIFALPDDKDDLFRIGQQVDAFIPARRTQPASQGR
jgi:RND family efflux transporter MFP subunit